MNNRERQMIKAATWYIRSYDWYFMDVFEQAKEVLRISSVIKRSRSKRRLIIEQVTDLLEKLAAENERLKARCEAAESDFLSLNDDIKQSVGLCDSCIHMGYYHGESLGYVDECHLAHGCRWEWRGPQYGGTENDT